MPRPPRFTSDQILDAGLTLVAEGGAGALSISAIAARIGAPSGSIYHRFPSRDVLAATLWLRTITSFQQAVLPLLEHPDPVRGVREAAAEVLRWSRDHPAEVGLLARYRADDLLDEGWPEELRGDNEAQLARLTDVLARVCGRLGADDEPGRRRVLFALVDVPYAAIRAALARGQVPDAIALQLVDEAVIALLSRVTNRGG